MEQTSTTSAVMAKQTNIEKIEILTAIQRVLKNKLF